MTDGRPAALAAAAVIPRLYSCLFPDYAHLLIRFSSWPEFTFLLLSLVIVRSNRISYYFLTLLYVQGLDYLYSTLTT